MILQEAEEFYIVGAMSDTQLASHHHHWGWLDRLGMGLALVCAIHCLLTPVLVVCIPLIATSFWSDESFHLWMLALVLPLTTASMFLGCRNHRDKFTILLAVAGISFLIGGIFIGFSHGYHGHHHSILPASLFPHGWESFLTTLGGTLLVLAHIRNYRLCRKTSCSH